MKKINRAKILIICLVIYGISYAITQTIIYKISNDTQNLKINNQETQQAVDLLHIQINTLNSREKILNEHEDMQIRDNVYYLEAENEQQK